MTAYAIGSLTVHNLDWQQEYGEKMPASIARHGGKVLAKSAGVTLVGQTQPAPIKVAIEFDNPAQVRAWYGDPAHDYLRQLRRGKADVDLLLVNGV